MWLHDVVISRNVRGRRPDWYFFGFCQVTVVLTTIVILVNTRAQLSLAQYSKPVSTHAHRHFQDSFVTEAGASLARIVVGHFEARRTRIGDTLPSELGRLFSLSECATFVLLLSHFHFLHWSFRDRDLGDCGYTLDGAHSLRVWKSGGSRYISGYSWPI